MKVLCANDPKLLSRYAADRIADHLKANPRSVLGLATGSTPLDLYAELAEDFAAGKISFREARSFNLDEYVGLSGDHPASYRAFMEKNLFSQVDFPEGVNAVPSGVAEDLSREALQYEEQIAEAGGIDIQILGIGANGHIGFNEPAAVFEPLTHVVQLDIKTRADNARFFDEPEDVPEYALTMGVRTILWAREVLLLAFGAGKARAVRDLIKGKVDPQVPASILQLHPNVTILVDEEAASLLEEGDCERL